MNRRARLFVRHVKGRNERKERKEGTKGRNERGKNDGRAAILNSCKLLQ